MSLCDYCRCNRCCDDCSGKECEHERNVDAGDHPDRPRMTTTRGELAGLLGMSDRDVRDVVARLRRQGGNDPYVICSSSHNPPGYWRTDSDVEIMAYWAETHSRAKNTLAALKDVERFKALEGA